MQSSRLYTKPFLYHRITRTRTMIGNRPERKSPRLGNVLNFVNAPGYDDDDVEVDSQIAHTSHPCKQQFHRAKVGNSYLSMSDSSASKYESDPHHL